MWCLRKITKYFLNKKLMTSGEWDLCALKALEEEEQAQFLSISDSTLLDIPPPPPLHKKTLPTIKEHCGDTAVPTEEPVVTCNTLPKSILSSLSSSSASEASSSTPTFFKRNKKLFTKNSTSHPYKGLFKTNSTIHVGGGLNLNSNNYGSDFDIDCDSSTFVPSPKSLDSKEMMTMMMFLSSTASGAPPEVNSTSNAAGTGGGIFIEDELSKSFFPPTSTTTASPPSDRNNLFTSSEEGGGKGGVSEVTNKSDNRKRVHVNLCKKDREHVDECSKKCNGGNKSLLPPAIQVQSPLIDGLGNTVKLTTSTLGISSQTHKCSGIATTTIDGDDNENIVDELEEHIKHCSCSCNHMGYGNSMDYQVGYAMHSYSLLLVSVNLTVESAVNWTQCDGL